MTSDWLNHLKLKIKQVQYRNRLIDGNKFQDGRQNLSWQKWRITFFQNSMSIAISNDYYITFKFFDFEPKSQNAK